MFQFPPSPTPNQTFTPVAGVTYRWSGTAWHLIAGPGAFLTAADADTRYVNIDEAQNTTNRIINGKFAIDQRNAGAGLTVTGGAVYGPDRWLGVAIGTGVLVVSRGVLATSANDLLAVVQTPDATVGAGDVYMVTQRMEGVNLVDLNLGTASATSFTYTFDVHSSVAGLFAVTFRNFDGTRSYVAPYTIAAPSVYQSVSLTVPGEMSGTWNKANGIGMTASHTLGAPPAETTSSSNTWLNGNFTGVTGHVNFMATAGATYRITNVRLYKGSVDFGPDRRLYAEELALCQRYYEKSYQQTIVPGTIGRGGSTQFTQARAASTPMFTPSQSFKVIKRDAPTMTIYNPDIAGNQIHNIETASPFTLTAGFWASDSAFTLSCTTPASGLVGNACAYHWTASAEL